MNQTKLMGRVRRQAKSSLTADDFHRVFIDKSRRFATLLWMLWSRHTMQCHLAARLDTSGQLTVMTSPNSSRDYLISSARAIRRQPGYLKHVPAIWHPFVREFFQVSVCYADIEEAWPS